MSARLVGVDIGGSGIKAALVEVERGELVSERARVDTPRPAKADDVVAALTECVERLPASEGPIGIGFPGAIVGGTIMTAANLHKSWIGLRGAEVFSEALGSPTVVLNDADAAGLAEMRFGAGAGIDGTVLVLTLGTGIGSALFIDGRLVPNTEMGHIEVRGKDAERRASAGARERKGLSFKAWSKLLTEYIDAVDRLLWPDLVILGGGVSRRADRFIPLLEVRPRVVPATLENQAGIIGAALRAAESLPRTTRRAPARRRAAARGRSA